MVKISFCKDMQPNFIWFEFFWFSLKSYFERNTNPSLWSKRNGIILGFDEFTSTHVGLRMHRLNLCTSKGDLVKPLYKIIFQNFQQPTCSMYPCLWKKKIDLAKSEYEKIEFLNFHTSIPFGSLRYCILELADVNRLSFNI